MLDKSLADRYATALFKVAQHHNAVEATCRELDELRCQVQGVPRLHAVFFHPAISPAEKKSLAASVLGAHFSAPVMRFLDILFDSKRIHYLSLIADSFAFMRRRAEGRMAVTAVTARPIDAGSLERLGKALGSSLGRTIDISGEIDERIIAGIKLVFDDKSIIDASVAHSLEELRSRIISG